MHLPIQNLIWKMENLINLNKDKQLNNNSKVKLTHVWLKTRMANVFMLPLPHSLP